MTSRPARWWVLDQADGLVVHEGVDDVVQRVADDLLDRLDVPARAELRHELPHLLHLVVVGAADEVDELGVRRPQHRPAGDEAAGLELAAERQRARLRDDRLVEVEERCRRSGHRAHVLKCRQNGGFPHDTGHFASTGVASVPLSTDEVRRRRRAAWSLATASGHGCLEVTAPLLVSADPLLVADVQRLCAAAGVVPEVVRDSAHALRPWSGAPVVLVGADCAASSPASSPPRRPRVHVLGRSPVGDALFRDALGVGAETVAGLPASETWLVELLTDVGDGGAAPGVTIGVIGGSGGAGATVFAAALAQMAADRRADAARRRRPDRCRDRPRARARAHGRHPVGLDAADHRAAELAVAARGAAAGRAALRAHLADGPAGVAAGVRDARGALGRAARLRHGGRRPAAPSRRGGRGDDHPLRPRRAGLDADRAGRQLGGAGGAPAAGVHARATPGHAGQPRRGHPGVGEPAAADAAARGDGRPARARRGDQPRCRAGAVASRHPRPSGPRRARRRCCRTGRRPPHERGGRLELVGAARRRPRAAGARRGAADPAAGRPGAARAGPSGR